MSFDRGFSTVLKDEEMAMLALCKGEMQLCLRDSTSIQSSAQNTLTSFVDPGLPSPFD